MERETINLTLLEYKSITKRKLQTINFQGYIINHCRQVSSDLARNYLKGAKRVHNMKTNQRSYLSNLTSETINLLPKKSFGGNLAIKIDTAKAFDTMDRNFIVKVLKTFDFYSWIQQFCILPGFPCESMENKRGILLALEVLDKVIPCHLFFSIKSC
jgi:hypothetical protein